MAITKSQKSKVKSQKLFFLFLILLILTVASFFRLWRLNSVPPGLYPDEAINGNEAISNPGQIFYPENNGREGLFINLIALSFSVFGISIWSIRIVAAVIGILTVFGLYLLTREFFNKNIALLSSFFLAISFWHVNFSRIGFRGILVPFILVFAFYFLFRAFRTRKFSDFLISGLFWGTGFYTYTVFRMALLILAIILALKLIEFLKEVKVWKGWRKVYLQKNWWKFDFFVLVIILVALPILIYFLQNPGDFIGRTSEVSVFVQENPIKALGKSLILHLGMFNFYGDWNWRHNFAGSPQLFWPVGILFLLGFCHSLYNLIKSIMLRSSELLVRFGTLVGWFFIMLLPGILTYEGIPHALRTIGVIPVVYIFAGVGGWQVFQWLDEVVRNKKLLIVLCSLFIIAISYGQYCRYFLNWATRAEVRDAFCADYVRLGNYLNSLPQDLPKYVIVNMPGVPVPWPDGIPMPAQTVMFVESTKYGRPQATYLLPQDLEKIKIEKEAKVVKLKYE